MSVGIAEVLAERRSRAMWEAVTECEEEANECQVLEEATINAARDRTPE